MNMLKWHRYLQSIKNVAIYDPVSSLYSYPIKPYRFNNLIIKKVLWKLTVLTNKSLTFGKSLLFRINFPVNMAYGQPSFVHRCPFCQRSKTLTYTLTFLHLFTTLSMFNLFVLFRKSWSSIDTHSTKSWNTSWTLGATSINWKHLQQLEHLLPELGQECRSARDVSQRFGSKKKL